MGPDIPERGWNDIAEASIFVEKANSKGAKCFCEVWLNLIILFHFGILPLNSGEGKKEKVFAAFWFYLSPEFWISCCQVGITF